MRNKVKKSKLSEARENASNRIVIAWIFASDWVKESHEFSTQIKSRCELVSKHDWKLLL